MQESIIDKRIKAMLLVAMAGSVAVIGCRQSEPDGRTHIEQLVRLLYDGDPAVHGRSAEQLVALGQPAVEPLVEFLEDEYDKEEFRIRALEVLTQIGEPAVIPLLNLSPWSGELNDIDKALVRMGRSQTPHMIAALQDSSCLSYLRAAKVRAAKVLAELKDPRAVEPLIHLLDDNRLSFNHTAIVYALGNIGDPRAVEPLVSIVQMDGARNDSPELVRAAVRALGKIEDPRGIPCLTDALMGSSASPCMCLAASDALVAIGKPAVPGLIGAMQEEHVYVRSHRKGVGIH